MIANRNGKKRGGPGNRQVVIARKHPTARDLEIHNRYCIGNEKRSALANEFDVSPTRISQIASAVGKWHRSHYRQEDHANRAKLATQLDAISDLALRKFHAQECPDPKLLAQVRANLAEIRGIWGL